MATAARRKAVTEEPKSNVPATQKSSVPSLADAPAFLAKHMERTAGMGYSHAAEDSIVPMVTLVQTLSPQVKPRHEKYIKGVMPGDMILKGALNPVVKQADGLICQPCAFQKAFIEWVPRSKGGGFVARHEKMPADVVERPDPENPERKKLIRKGNNNEVVETRYHFVRIGGAPFVIPFVSTGHTSSREWTQLIKNVGLGAPAFARYYKLTPYLRTRNDNEWFAYKAEALDWVTNEDEFLAGEAFCKAVMSGERAAEDPEDDFRGTEDNDSPM